MGTAGIEDAPPFIWKPLVTVYTRGMTFLQRSEKPSANEVAPGDYERAFSSPPRSTEQILHPDKYWNDEKRDDPRANRYRSPETIG
jgi:hypothetical protein